VACRFQIMIWTGKNIVVCLWRTILESIGSVPHNDMSPKYFPFQKCMILTFPTRKEENWKKEFYWLASALNFFLESPRFTEPKKVTSLIPK
jgi:hypothetical protein